MINQKTKLSNYTDGFLPTGIVVLQLIQAFYLVTLSFNMPELLSVTFRVRRQDEHFRTFSENIRRLPKIDDVFISLTSVTR